MTNSDIVMGIASRKRGDAHNLECNEKEIANCQTSINTDSMALEMNRENYRIRKLTPKECARLMGFDDEDADRLYKVESNSQMYKQMGNSIVVDVLEAIFGEMMQ